MQTTDRKELKPSPCPFCGGTKLFIGTYAEADGLDENDTNWSYGIRHYTVMCDYMEGGCGASIGGSSDTAEEAIEAWNRRAGEEK